jgi:carboxypeptidase Q
MRKLLLFVLSVIILSSAYSQESDEDIIKKIFDNVLLSDVAYNNLDYLCTNASGRLIGSDEVVIAVDFMKDYFKTLGVDTVFLQEFITPAWKCNGTWVSMKVDGKEINLRADALGPSPATTASGLIANVIEVQGLEDLKTHDRSEIEGKIVFYNRPVDMTLISTFQVYGSAVDQRYYGPAVAAEMGAAAVLVRSVSTRVDTFPHTGATGFADKKIPCAAISPIDANNLSKALLEQKNLTVKMIIDAEDIEEITSFNLIADITGSEFPEEYIVVGGHIDSWFNSQGAHDDGAGCVQSADVIRIFKELGIKNKRTIRVILFMDEELFQKGGAAYASYTKAHKINNYLAMEADAGGFAPEGFTVDASDSIIEFISGYQKILEPYGIYYIKKGGTGVDIGPLKKFNVPLMGYRTDPHRYMDLHHSAYDTFDKIHPRELQLGSGCMAAMIYLIDKNGL